MEKLEAIRKLREADPEAYISAVQALAQRHPSCAAVRLEAAYALHAQGKEEQAILHYDQTWELGPPGDAGPTFLLSYGAILRSLGRYDEALAILGEASARYPDYAPLRTVLALTLHSAGHGNAALATLLEVVLQLGTGDDALDGYEESLAAFQRQLLEDP